MKKQIFYEDAKKLFEENLMYEIYSTEKLCICNLADKIYGAFIFEKNSHQEQIGLLLAPNEVKEIAKDEAYLGKLARSMSEKQFSKYVIFMNDKFYQFLKVFKEKSKINGPSPSIDYDMEQELINMMNKKKGGR